MEPSRPSEPACEEARQLGMEFVQWWSEREGSDIGVARWSMEMDEPNTQSVSYAIECTAPECRKRKWPVVRSVNDRGYSSFSHKFTSTRHDCWNKRRHVSGSGEGVAPKRQRLNTEAEAEAAATGSALVDNVPAPLTHASGTLRKLASASKVNNIKGKEVLYRQRLSDAEISIKKWVNSEPKKTKDAILMHLMATLEDYGINFIYKEANIANPSTKETNVEVCVFIICEYCSNPKCKHPLVLNATANSWGSILLNVINHFKGVHHMNESKQLRIPQVIGYESSGLLISDFTADTQHTARRCLSYRPRVNDNIAMEVYQHHPNIREGSDYMREVGTYVLQLQSKNTSQVEPVATLEAGYRVATCQNISPFKNRPFPNFCCMECRRVGSNRAYVRQLKKRKSDAKRLAIDPHWVSRRPLAFEFQDRKTARFKQMKHDHGRWKLKYIVTRRRLYKVGKKAEDLLTRLERDAPLKAIVEDLLTAREKGLLESSSLMFKYLQDSARNRLAKKGGERWSVEMKRMMAAGKIKGGRRSLQHLSNLIDMSESTVDRFLKEERIPFIGGFTAVALRGNMTQVAKLISRQMEERGVPTHLRIPCIVGSDETPHLKKFSVSIKEKRTGVANNIFKIVGACCKKGSGGCSFGNVDEAENITNIEDLDNLYANFRQGGHASALIICPLHELLSDFPVGFACCCNRFTEAQFQSFWDEVFVPIFQETVGVVLNYSHPLGLHSDGDGRRSNIQWQRMDPSLFSDAELANKYILDHECIGLAASMCEMDDGRKVFYDIMGQDLYHILKNFANLADSSSRTLTIKDRIISIGAIRAAVGKGKAVTTRGEILAAAVSQKSLDRADKMNVQNVQNLIKLESLDALLQYCDDGHPDAIATWWYCDVMFKMRMMYNATAIPITTRIEYCADVITSLFSWYQWIVKESKNPRSGISVKKNFITMRTFRNAILACNCWLLQLIAVVEGTNMNFYEAWKSGSNCCEILFSKLCGFGGIEAGKRDETFAEMLRLIANLLTLLGWEGDPENGYLKDPRRSAKHDPDRNHMKKDEERIVSELGFTPLEIPATSVTGISVCSIKEHLDKGVSDSLERLRTKLGLNLVPNYKVVYKALKVTHKKKKGQGIVEEDGGIEEEDEEEEEGRDVPDDELGAQHDDIAGLDSALLLRLTKVGDRVEARYDGCDYWVVADVLNFNEELNQYEVKYLDGTIETGVRATLVRPFLPYIAGDEVYSLFGNNRSQFFRATIDAVGDDSFDIRFEDTPDTLRKGKKLLHLARKFKAGEVLDYSDLIATLPSEASSEEDAAQIQAVVEADAADEMLRLSIQGRVGAKEKNVQYHIKDSKGEVYDILKYNALFAGHFTSKLSRDRMKKFVEAAKVTPGGTKKSGDSNTMFCSGTFVCVWFRDEDSPFGVRFWLGEIVKVSRKAGKTLKPVVKPVEIGAFVKGSVFVECVWYKPVPQPGETTFNASVYTVMDRTEERRAHKGEVKADYIISCPDMYRIEGTNSFRMHNSCLEYALDQCEYIGLSAEEEDEAFDEEERTDDEE